MAHCIEKIKKMKSDGKEHLAIVSGKICLINLSITVSMT